MFKNIRKKNPAALKPKKGNVQYLLEYSLFKIVYILNLEIMHKHQIFFGSCAELRVQNSDVYRQEILRNSEIHVSFYKMI